MRWDWHSVVDSSFESFDHWLRFSGYRSVLDGLEDEDYAKDDASNEAWSPEFWLDFADYGGSIVSGHERDWLGAVPAATRLQESVYDATGNL